MPSRNFGLYFFFGAIALSAFLVAPASAGHITVVFDFETDDFGTTLVNGQSISTDPDVQTDTVFEFGKYAEIRTSFGSGDGHEGAAIFDSDDTGPNNTTHDDDLLVNLGNILILQSEESPATTSGANGTVFTTPNDEASINTGSIIFDFTLLVEPLSIDIVDANGGFGADVIMTDVDGNTRTYTIPEMWTFEISTDGLDGYETLDLTETVLTQPGEGGGVVGLPVDVGSFDASLVATLEVKITGTGGTSGGIDNLTFNIPEPTSLALVVLGVLASLPARRRRARKNA